MSNAFKQICEFIKSEEFTTAFEQFKASKEPKKEWEIVAYMEKFTKSVVASPSCLEWKAAEKGHNSYTIHSVRRLSDGLLFSIGEKFLTGAGRISVITSFVINRGKMEVHFEIGSNDLQHIKKLPVPLFTTLDGVEIHEGDLFWGIRDWKILDGGKADKYDKVFDKAGETFSTREAAQEYIENNKPLLSLNDVKEAWNDFGWLKHEEAFEKLTNLVKQKLNP